MTQTQALDVLKTGGNIFLTGEPGAGKTYVLNEYIEWLLDCGVEVAVTASTGIAATHIGGMTIHAWSGIGARDELTPQDLDRIARNERVVRRVKKASVLVIDEISMLDGRVLDMIERVCRTIRQKEEAFGGLQIVLVGDFFQLPPIARRGDMARFSFESNSWQRAQFLTCYLTEQHRQEDELLLSLLSSIRKNQIEEEHYTLLGEQTEIGFEHVEPTRLFTHNKDVDATNTQKLQSLNTDKRVFTMSGRGARAVVDGLKKNCLSPERLELRLEAMVMCTKNNFEAGYVNGTLGRVVDFDFEEGHPIIETSEGRKIKISPASWSVADDGKITAEVTQIPLRLAWAITIHKSQGMSLDAAEIDLRNAFTYGQGYVALSRVRTLAGMKVLGLNNNALVVDPKIVKMDERFHAESDDAEHAFTQMDTEEITKMQENFVSACGGTIPKEGEERVPRSPAVRFKKESTTEITKSLVQKGLSVRKIAKERDMAESTIWRHIETLVTEGELSRAELDALIPKDTDWTIVYGELCGAMDEVGSEKLKPIYEALGERYDYDIIRLGRMCYTAPMS